MPILVQDRIETTRTYQVSIEQPVKGDSRVCQTSVTLTEEEALSLWSNLGVRLKANNVIDTY